MSSVTLYGFEGLINRISKLQRTNPEIVLEATHKGMLVVERVAKENVATGKDPGGELKSKIVAESQWIGNTLSSFVIAGAPHGKYVEFGTGPKGKNSPKDLPPNIRPVYKNVGWFVHIKDFPGYAAYGFVARGNFIYTTGQAAQPFLYPAFRDNKEMIKRTILESTKRSLQE